MEVAVRGEWGVAGEGRVIVHAPKFPSLGKCIMPPLACVLTYLRASFRLHLWGDRCNAYSIASYRNTLLIMSL